MEGKVKFYNAKKAFGFIKGDDGNEYFVHRTELKKGIKLFEDTPVEFIPIDTEKGKQAKKVTVKDE